MRSSTSLDELENMSFGSAAHFANGSFATEGFERRLASRHMTNFDALFSTLTPVESGDDEWEVLTRKIDSKVRMDAEFFEYPPHLCAPDAAQGTSGSSSNVGIASAGSPSPALPGGLADVAENPEDIKVFLGGMRFELVQLGKQAVAWLLEVGCKVTVNPSKILVHRRARNGRLAPTGCASVFVASEAEAQALLAMNQRIFSGLRGLFVAQSSDQMAALIQSRSILDVVDGRVRGPTHPIVIEKAYASQLPSSNNSFVGTTTGGSSLSPSTNASFAAHIGRPPPPDPGAPLYHRFHGQDASIGGHERLEAPAELFVGGLCYEATQHFVAWMFQLMGVPLHPNNVTLYVDPSTGVKRGCAQIKTDERDFERAMQFNKRVLCDTHGVYIADTPQGIYSLQASREKHVIKGPTHPVVIERRRNGRTGAASGGSGAFARQSPLPFGPSPPPSTTSPPTASAAHVGFGSHHHHHHHLPAYHPNGRNASSPPQYNECAWNMGGVAAPATALGVPPMSIAVAQAGHPVVVTPPMFQAPGVEAAGASPPPPPPPPSYVARGGKR